MLSFRCILLSFLSMILLFPTSAFEMDPEFGMHSVIQKMSRRNQKERESQELNDFNSISYEEDCSKNGVEKRSVEAGDKKLRRKKRATIAWPIRSKFTAELYYAIPLLSPPQITIPVAFGLPFTFDLPNVTDTFKLRKRSIEDRYSIYGAVEGIFQSFGMDGKNCILRAICERAEHHLVTNGVLSELVNLILAVTSTSDGTMYDYIDAEKQGRMEGNCKERYSNCPFSIFKLLGTY